MVGDVRYPYGGHQVKASVARIATSIARATSDYGSVWPGEYFEALCNINPLADLTVAIEPHTSAPLSVAPEITTSLQGQLRFINNTDKPVKIRRGQHIAHVSDVYTPLNDLVTTKMDSVMEKQSVHNVDASRISINPDNGSSFANAIILFSA